MSQIYHIAVSTNERYVVGALQALAGVAVNARPDTELCFHVFTENVKEASIDWMQAVLMRLHPNSKFVQHECGEELLSGLPYWANSRMAAVRCYYAKLMPDVDWCLYLDCDILYLANIEEHFSYRDEEKYACVVQEEDPKTRKLECKWIKDNCGITIPDDEYFNSGVVLFNFKKMREDGIPNKLANFFKMYPDVTSPDQDALNAIFGGNIKLMPAKYDRLQIYLNDKNIEEKPVIHYVCGNPWLNKYATVANNRFRLWHKFADRYIWQKSGESYRRLFSKKVIAVKYVCYWLLVLPVFGMAFAKLMQVLGCTKDGVLWRWEQIGNDISRNMVNEVIS